MANITTLLQNIKKAMMGGEIRQTIHDAIKQCYIDATRTTGSSNSEVVAARGDYETLAERLDNIVTLDTLDKIEEQTIIPTAENQYLEAGKYINGTITIQGDANLVAENIARDSNIYNIKGSVDRIRRIDGYSGGSGYYGIEVADVARSYHLARVNGHASFQYSQNDNIWNGQITNSAGHCLIDCSTFVALCLRGIDYLHSPYNNATGIEDATFTSTDIALASANSEYLWADEWLDKQTDPSFRDIGLDGYRSVRTAAQIAEYYYGGRGSILYEYETSPTEVPSGLLPGDLVFWSKESASDAQKSRFKAISHVALVSKDGVHYYHATGSETIKGTTIQYSSLETHLEEISLILRPDYNPRVVVQTPLNHNLLPQYEFSSCGVQSNTVKNGVVFAPRTDKGFDIQGAPQADTTFYVCANNDAIPLEPGTYILSGTPIHSEISDNSQSLRWGLSFKDIGGNDTFTDVDGNRAWDRGQGCTFKITATAWIRVYFYISGDLTDDATYTVKPSLIKIN